MSSDNPESPRIQSEDAPPRSLRLPTRARLRDHAAFRELMKSGMRATDGRLALWARCNGLSITRFGLVVGRKHGGAADRNLLRRRLREAFRLCRQRLPSGLDLAVAPIGGADITVAGAIESLERLSERLARRLAGT
ncbi:MAG: ribonuclease P protein component [Planctomycetes bacterium]|nr:ribonuclease P protein component [Planctomycetota bacterium]